MKVIIDSNLFVNDEGYFVSFIQLFSLIFFTSKTSTMQLSDKNKMVYQFHYLICNFHF